MKYSVEHINSECPRSKRDCDEYNFHDDKLGDIPRRDCIKWVRNMNYFLLLLVEFGKLLDYKT